MYCHQCGAWISVTDAYCAICGAETASIVERLTDRVLPHTQPKKSVFIRRYTKRAVLFMLFVGIVAAGVYYAPSILALAKSQNIGQKNSDDSAASTASEQIEDVFNQKLQPIFRPSAAQVQKLCADAVRDLYTTPTNVSFSYEQESQIKEVNQAQKRWQLSGFFRLEDKNNQPIKQGYACSVQLADKKQQRNEAGVAVMLY